MRCSTFAGGVGLLLLFSIAGAQAQMPPPAETPSAAGNLAAAIAPISWTGPYFGLQLGAGSISDKLSESTSFVPPQTGHANRDSAGVVGGAHAGFNWQFGGIVFGPEGDLEGVASSHSSRCLLQDVGGGNPAPNTCFDSALGYRFSTTIDWQASLRARLGYAFGDALFYGTGGAAFAGIRTSYSQSVGGRDTAQSFSQTRTGFTIGAGLEYAFSGNWRSRLEYRYTDYGKFSDNTTAAGSGTFWDGYTNHHTMRANTVRIGLTYAFGAP